MPEIDNNGIRIKYQEAGSKENPAVLLVMGLHAQLIAWPDEFFYGLADKGYRVIRYDHRDTGLSSKLVSAGRPEILKMFLRKASGMTLEAPYTLEDMASDAVTLLYKLGITQGHLIGCSMGGIIAQIIAAKYRNLALTLTVMMSTTNNPRISKPSWKVMRKMLFSRPRTENREQLICYYMDFLRIIGSPAYPTPEEDLREMVRRIVERSYYPDGLFRHLAAVYATGDIRHYTRQIETPSLIIHGKSDILARLEACFDLARNLPNATIRLFEGMGHDLPEKLIPGWINLIDAHIQSNANN